MSYMDESKWWTMERLVSLLADLADSGWGLRTSMYGTHSGDHTEKPWRGPLACEITVTGWREHGPVSLDDVNRLAEVVARHGAEMELSLAYADDDRPGGVARVGVGSWGERILVGRKP